MNYTRITEIFVMKISLTVSKSKINHDESQKFLTKEVWSYIVALANIGKQKVLI